MAIVERTVESENEATVSRVLLIEDNPMDVEIVRRSFRKDQMVAVAGAISLTVAGSLSEATALLADEIFDAILLDLGLPEGVGLEILNQVTEWNLRIPIVILTGNEDDALGVAALRAGADDYLKKSSVSHDTLPRSVRYSIERNHRIVAEAQLQRTQAEILAAETIQQKLLPRISPKVTDFDIHGACLPAEKVGGDLFDFLSYDQTSCVGVVADVSGHGLPAAILMTELHGLLHGLVEQNVSLPRLMLAANYRTDRATEPHQFITMLAYHLSSCNRSFSYISAGHPAWVIRNDGSNVALKSQHLPLGVDSTRKVMSLEHVRLSLGDIVVLPTDGVFESLGPDRARYGSQRMLQFIAERKDLPAQEIVKSLIQDVQEFTGGPLLDDCTLVIVKSIATEE